MLPVPFHALTLQIQLNCRDLRKKHVLQCWDTCRAKQRLTPMHHRLCQRAAELVGKPRQAPLEGRTSPLLRGFS